MARQKKLYSLLDVKKETGISYPTLVKYARDFADQIPAVGFGRSRRYTVESIRVFQRIYAKRRPGRRSGEAWVKHPDGTPIITPLMADGSKPGQLQLAPEDRELIQKLTEALREVSAKLEAFTEAGGKSGE